MMAGPGPPPLHCPAIVVWIAMLVLVAVSANTLASQQASSIGCIEQGEGAATTANMKRCASEKVAQSTEQLEHVYSELRERLVTQLEEARSSDDDMQLPLSKQLEYLDQSHQAFRAYRDATCYFAYYQYFPGSLAELERLTCVRALNERRTDQIQAIASLMGEPIGY
jgi:uncharacterized protein YecT (DUF1311 family)